MVKTLTKVEFMNLVYKDIDRKNKERMKGVKDADSHKFENINRVKKRLK